MSDLEIKVNYYILRRILKQIIDVDSIANAEDMSDRLIQVIEIIMKLDEELANKKPPHSSKDAEAINVLAKAKEVSEMLGL